MILLGRIKPDGLTVFVLIGILSSVAGLFIYWYKPIFLSLVDLKARDAMFVLKGRATPPEGVCIVAIDERSVNRLGRWPWTRSIMAELIERLKPAKVTALDIVFSEPQNEREDLNLSEAIGRADNVVLGYFLRNDSTELPPEEAIQQISTSSINLISYIGETGMEDGGLYFPGYEFSGAEVNIPLIGRWARGFGTFNIIANDDGIYRTANLVYGYMGMIYPSLALEAVRHYMEGEPILYIAEYGIDSIDINDTTIPLDGTGGFTLNFYGPGGTFPTYSAVDVIEGRIGEKELKGRIVFVGATEKAIYDIRPTPVDSLFPGVEIHATVAGNILQKRFLIRDSRCVLVDLFLMVVLPLLFSIIVSRVHRTMVSLGVFVVLLSLTVSGTFYLFSSYNLLTSVVYPLLSLTIAYLSCEAYRNIVVEKRNRFIKKAFSTYVSPQLLTELMRNPERLKLGGEKRVVSVLFSDIRGFTSLSERLPPDELVVLLNEYLNPMTRIIIEERGTLDKYIGDAIMAIYNAPVEIEDHPGRVCNTALRMREKLKELNEGWVKKGLPTLDIGIGINTGEAVIGNMGAELRFDYTAIGDTVNLASRLEGMNKLYGTNILVSESTYGHVKDIFLFRELDLVRVKGKEKPIVMYELMDYRDDGRAGELVESFLRGIRLYRERRFREAIVIFEDILKRYPNDGPSRLYVQRCSEYISSPPPDDWDGVFVARTK